MKLLIYSDVHLERQQFSPGPNAREADLVVLAGDVGQGTEGLRWARKIFKDQPIIMVLGNHEFFGWRDFVDFVDEARNKALELDIDLLECGETSVGGVRFLGATLWTDYELFSPDADEFRLLKKEARFDRSGHSAEMNKPGTGRVGMVSMTGVPARLLGHPAGQPCMDIAAHIAAGQQEIFEDAGHVRCEEQRHSGFLR